MTPSPQLSEGRSTTVSIAARTLGAIAAFAAALGLVLQVLAIAQQSVFQGLSVGRALATMPAYFTVVANLFVVIVFGSASIRHLARRFPWVHSPTARGVATTNITLVGIIFLLLLRSVWHPEGLGVPANVLLHYISPLACIAAWIVGPHQAPPRWTDPLRWLVFPVTYAAALALRALFAGSLPYPFFDLTRLNLTRVLANAGAICLVFLIVAIVLVGIARWRKAD